jgi:hypothetical protein
MRAVFVCSINVSYLKAKPSSQRTQKMFSPLCYGQACMKIVMLESPEIVILAFSTYVGIKAKSQETKRAWMY